MIGGADPECKSSAMSTSAADLQISPDGDSEDFRPAAFLSPFLPQGREERLQVFDTLPSTNAYLLQEESFVDGMVCLANAQTAGQGRKGRSFLSPGGMGVYLSYLLVPDEKESLFPATSFSTLTAYVCIAVSRAVSKVCGRTPDIKWVNDLQLDGKKFCGILTQMSLFKDSDRVKKIVTGIGINVLEKEEDFPDELKKHATSLAQATGRQISRAALVAELILQLDRMREDWRRELHTSRLPSSSSKKEHPQNANRCLPGEIRQSYLVAYRSMDVVKGKDIRVMDWKQEREAKALGIGDNFELLVRFQDTGAEEALTGGEITIRPMEGD